MERRTRSQAQESRDESPGTASGWSREDVLAVSSDLQAAEKRVAEP
jgi:hypothetical protein